MARGQHDQPNPNLIVEGSRKILPTKRIQGEDYPTTVLERSDQRKKGFSYEICATAGTALISILLYRYRYSDNPKLHNK